jgi:16S rRNA (adenine1518-N6/adenine1519-N6)-dimethyltransferase
MANGNRVNAGEVTLSRSRKPRGKAKLGQNFLADRGAAVRIVEALGDISARTVVEIGPGRGALTEVLAGRAGRLIAIEVDRILAAQLRMKYAARRTVEIIEADVLSIDFDGLFRPRPGALTGFVPILEKADVVGNIPYYITSDILLRLFAFHPHFETLVLMVQREVADRIAAKPGSRDYGLLSATAQLYAKVEKLFTLPPGAFAPPPKVHSSVLRLKIAPRFERLRVGEADFTEFLKLSFGQKRKTLMNNLKTRYAAEQIRAALQQAGARADVRAEALPLEKAATVFRFLSEKSLS